MATKATAREVFAYMLEHREMFPNVTDEEIATFENSALRGDLLNVISRKTTFSAEVPEATAKNKAPQSAQGIFADMIVAFAAEVFAGVKPSGTSKDRRMTVQTSHGPFTFVLSAVDTKTV